MITVFDIDGVLADNRHRFHFIEQAPKNWDAYYDGIHLDKLIEPVAILIETMSLDSDIYLCTGRPTRFNDRTIKWLDEAGIWKHITDMFNRDDDDYRPNQLVKEDMALEITKYYGPIDLVFEDDSRSVEMWRKYARMVLEVQYGIL